MKIKHLGIVGLTVAILTVGIVFADGYGADPKYDGTEVPQTLGSITSPDITNPYLAVNGVITYYNHPDMKLGTSTACVIKSPAATSTTGSFAAKINTATGTQAYMELVKSTTPFAPNTSTATSTSLLASTTIAANKTTEFYYTFNSDIATSSQQTSDFRNIIAPNTYFIYYAKALTNGLQTSTYNSGQLYTGSCRQNFEVL